MSRTTSQRLKETRMPTSPGSLRLIPTALSVALVISWIEASEWEEDDFDDMKDNAQVRSQGSELLLAHR